jgi:hypothetical protein
MLVMGDRGTSRLSPISSISSNRSWRLGNEDNMPLNLSQLEDGIASLAKYEAARQSSFPDGLNAARQALLDAADCQDAVQACVRSAATAEHRLRCGLPSHEQITQSFSPPDKKEALELIAVDGSQIAPDIHATLQYGIINVAGMHYPYGNDDHPTVETYSEIWEPAIKGEISNDLINQERDYRERTILTQLCVQSNVPCVGLIDGGIEIWAGDTGKGNRYKRWMQFHIRNMHSLCDNGVALGGYIDNPAASPVLRMLALAIEGRLIKSDYQVSWEKISLNDRELFGAILGSGQRSAIFELVSPSSSEYTGNLSLNFFYFNAGTVEDPEIARVEVPEWVALNPKILNRLHSVLVHQCRLVSGFPYPYVLARAHEEARLGETDRRILERLINEQLLAQHAAIDLGSAKQAFKQIL